MFHFSKDLETRKFLVGPETFGLKLLVSFLVSVLVPVFSKFQLPGFVLVPILETFRLPDFVLVPGNLLLFVP